MINGFPLYGKTRQRDFRRLSRAFLPLILLMSEILFFTCPAYSQDPFGSQAQWSDQNCGWTPKWTENKKTAFWYWANRKDPQINLPWSQRKPNTGIPFIRLATLKPALEMPPEETLRGIIPQNSYCGVIKIIGKASHSTDAPSVTEAHEIIKVLRKLVQMKLPLPCELTLEAEQVLTPMEAAKMLTSLRDSLKTFFPEKHMALGWNLSPAQATRKFVTRGLALARQIQLIPYPGSLNLDLYQYMDLHMARKMIRLAREAGKSFRIVLPFHPLISAYDKKGKILFPSLDIDEDRLFSRGQVMDRSKEVTRVKLRDTLPYGRTGILSPGVVLLLHSPRPQTVIDWARNLLDNSNLGSDPLFQGFGLFSWPLKKSFSPSPDEFLTTARAIDDLLQ